MQKETTIEILDQYLLTGQATLQEVTKCLARHTVMPYLRHLELTELAEGLPQDEAEATRRLLRLRLLFVDSYENDVLFEQLFGLRTLHLHLRAYTHNQISRRDLESRINSTLSDFPLDAMVRQTLYDLRYTLAEDPEEVPRVDVANACFKTLRRLEALWFAVLK